jgi:hypothetical protein
VSVESARTGILRAAVALLVLVLPACGAAVEHDAQPADELPAGEYRFEHPDVRLVPPDPADPADPADQAVPNGPAAPGAPGQDPHHPRGLRPGAPAPRLDYDAERRPAAASPVRVAVR